MRTSTSFHCCYLPMIFLTATLLGGCVNNPDSTAHEPDTLISGAYLTPLALYSLLAPAIDGSTLIYARAIIEGVETSCPALTINGDPSSTLLTTVRKVRPPLVNNKEQFNVTVCEAIIPGDTAANTTYSLGSMSLAPINLDVTNIQVYGDSGCKTSQGDCSDLAKPSQSFNKLVKKDPAQNIDLLLHMGDYNYRGTSGLKITGLYDAGDGTTDPQCQYDAPYISQNAEGTFSSKDAHPDGWQYWQSDFFLPAQPLSAKASWIFARGNHELCSRAGPGWFYFLGPGSSLDNGIRQLHP